LLQGNLELRLRQSVLQGIEVCPLTIEIPLSRGLAAIIDDEDAPLVRQFKWCAKPGKKTFYAVRRMLAAEGRGRRLQALHSFLTGWAMIDHVNGDGLDNRRVNLRETTDRQNKQNMRKHRGVSAFKGVSWNKRDLRWTAHIRTSGRMRHLGYFANEVEAALAYDAAARLHFGEFAALNFPVPGERSALMS
jgi:hypothetical protein